MANSLKELIVTYEANARPVLDALNQIDARLKQTTKSIQNIGDSFKRVGYELGAVFTIPLGILSAKALQASADFESLKMQMEVLTSSAAEGERVFQRLVKFAAETPFELNQLSKATNTLMGFGETADEAYNHLQLIGDVAAVSGGDFNGITVAFGQVSAAGKLMGQDLLQLVNNGVPVIKMLADEMGVPKEKIKDLVSEGKVTFPILVRAFERATSKGGMFEGGMQKLSRTSKGVWSTFKDNVNIALAKFGDEMQKAFSLTDNLEKFGNWIGRLADNFTKLYPETKRNIFIFLGLIAVIGPLLILVGTLTRLFALMSLGFTTLLVPIRLLISGFGILLGVLRAFMLVFAANPLIAFVASTIAIIYYWREIVDLFRQAFDWLSKLSISKVWDKVKNFAGEIKADLGFNNDNAAAAVSTVNNSNAMSSNKTVNNNLVVNIPSNVGASDSVSIKNAIRQALQEENRQSYIELGAQ